MLTQLSIRDYILVDKLDMDFTHGFTVITGETGAGKSIIVDVLSLLFGERVKIDVIRQGKEKALLQGTFLLEKSIIKSLLFKELNIEAEGDEIICRREINLDGKNRYFINGLLTPLQTIKKLGLLLLDIHGQHELQSLFDDKKHLAFLDAYAGIEIEKEDFSSLFSQYSGKAARLKELAVREKLLKEKKELLEHQQKELIKADLKEGREQELLSRIHFLENGTKTRALEEEISRLLDEEITPKWTRLKKLFETLAQQDSRHHHKIKILDEIHVQQKELLSGLAVSLDEATAEEALDEMNEKLAIINKLKRKYNCDEKGLLLIKNEIDNSLSFLVDSGGEKDSLEKEIKILEKQLQKKAEALSTTRKKAAQKLEKEILPLLSQMNLERAAFSCVFSKKAVLENDGMDEMEFHITTNPGEPLRPLAKIASGGETARIMLAIKTILAKSDKTPILVFDEIDTGIGGETAGKIGLLLKNLSKLHQVFCVTHSHLIAKEADTHFTVTKKISADHTLVRVELLSDSARIKEIARMLGDAESKITRSHAELLIRR